jgi:outer membrane receptor for ferrienterochelin and colicins
MHKKIISLLLLGSTFNSPAYAAGQADDPVAEYSSITRYSFDYFAEFAPVTLLDMLQRIPEAQQILAQSTGGNNRGQGGGRRGFGAGGDQILINGKRLSGKANNISDTMARVSAGTVKEIQLIRGAVEGLDVQSEGLVINIQLEAGISTSTTFWNVGGVYYEGFDVNPTFTFSHSGSSGKFEYLFGVERKHFEFHFDRDEIYTNADGELTESLFVEGDFIRPSTAFTTNLTYAFEEHGTLRLNGLYEPRSNDGQELRIEEGDGAFYRRTPRESTGNRWEIGGDYERQLGSLGQLKTLFVANRDQQDEFDERFSAPDATFNSQSLTEITNRSERILRASLTRPIFGNQTLELGGEGAFNTFDQKFDQLTFSDENTISSIDAQDEVEIGEKRYEVFGIHNYNFSNAISLQSSLITEFSTITADTIIPTGGVSRRQTSFTFLKPRFNARYDITETDQLRLLAEKEVSQLDFGNFITRWDNAAQVLIEGNTAIKPQERWRYSATLEHRFAKNLGTVQVEVFYADFKDFIGNVDFSEYQDELGNVVTADQYFALPPSDGLRDATSFTARSGNIRKATAYGARLISNIRLDNLGVTGGVINVNYLYARRRTTDQFTGEERRWDRRSDHDLRIGYRQDLNEWRVSYGVNARYRSDFERFFIRYYWPNSPAIELGTFAEMIIFDGIRARIEGSQLTGKRQESILINYSDHIRFNDVTRIDDRRTRTAQEIRFSLQGTF